MIVLKKLLWSSALVALLLSGCRDSPENQDEENPIDTENLTGEVDDVEGNEDAEDVEAEGLE